MKRKISMALIVMGIASLTACKQGKSNDTTVVTDSVAEAVVNDSSNMQDATTAATAVQDSIETVVMPTPKQAMKIINDSWQKKLKDTHPVLKELGMTLLKYVEEQDEEEPGLTYYYICYGKNIKVETRRSEYGYDEYRLHATGPHAVAIELNLDTDNGEEISFSDKEDYLNFKRELSSIKSQCDVVSPSDEPQNGWYKVMIHM